MESPSSFARITRSSIPISRKKEECDNKVEVLWKERKQALFDITNDSPIIGVAQGRAADTDKKAKQTQTTPGSGEALLREQVKILLQKVDDGSSSQESQEVDDDDVTRALMFDFFDKPEDSSSSSPEGATNKEDDDDPCVWSILVNTSSERFVIDQVCEGIANISVKASGGDDEVVNDRSKWSILHLKGIEIPQGKQLRFQEEEEED